MKCRYYRADDDDTVQKYHDRALSGVVSHDHDQPAFKQIRRQDESARAHHALAVGVPNG